MPGMDLPGVLNAPVADMQAMKRDGFYDMLPWDEGKATEFVLDILDQSNFAGRADSPETRKIASDMAGMYRGVEGGNQKLINLLETWSKDGLAGVRQLVQQGLAPAAVLALLSGLASEEPDPTET